MKALLKILPILFLCAFPCASKAGNNIAILVLPTINVGQNSEFDLAGFAVANTLETMHNKIPAIREGYLGGNTGLIVANARDLLDAYSKEFLRIPVPVLEAWAEKTKCELIVSGRHRIEQNRIYLNLHVFTAGNKQVSSVSISGDFEQSLRDAKKSWLSVLDNYIDFSEDIASRVLMPETTSVHAFKNNGEVYFHWLNNNKTVESLQRAFSAADEGVKDDHSYSLLLKNHAYLHLQSGKLIEARKNLQLAIENDPFLIEAIYGLIQIYLTDLEFTEAEKRADFETIFFAAVQNDPIVVGSSSGLIQAYLDDIEIEKAKKLAEKKLLARGEPGGFSNREVVRLLSDWAKNFAARFTVNTEKARRLFILSILLRKEIGEYVSKEVASCLQNIGDIYLSEKKYEDAVIAYDEALQLFSSFENANQHLTQLALTYRNIGLNYYKLEEHEKALKTYVKALSISRKIFGNDHPNVAFIYNNISLINAKLGNYQEALEGHRKSLAINRKLLGDKHSRVAVSYDNIALVYFDLGKYEEALEGHKKALEIRKTALGSNPLDVAISHINMAIAYKSLGKYKKALEEYKNALNIRQKILGIDHPDVALVYNDMSVIYEMLGEYEKAIDGHRKALTIRQKTFGNDHPDVAQSNYNMAIVYNSKGEYERALEGHKIALAIRKKTLGNENPDVARSYNAIAHVYSNQGKYTKALEMFDKALALSKEKDGKNLLSIATIHNNIGAVYSELGEYEKSIEEHNKALVIRKEMLGDNDPDLALTYGNIGNVHLYLGEYEKAIEYYTKTLAVQKGVENNPQFVATTYDNMAAAHLKLGEHDKALEEHQEALKIRRKLLRENHSDLAVSYNNLARLYQSLGQYEEAFALFKQALSINKRTLGDNHPRLASAYNNLATLSSSLGRHAKSLEFLITAKSIILHADQKTILGTVLANIGYVYEKLDDLDNSITSFRKAIELKEETIVNLEDEKHQEAYFALQRNVYEAIVRVLLRLHKLHPDKGYDKEALEYMDRDRITKLRRQMQNVIPEDVGFRQGYDKITRLEWRLTKREQQRNKELNKPLEEQNPAKIDNLTKLITQGEREYHAIVNDLKRKYPIFARLLGPIDRENTIAGSRKHLPHGQILIMFYPTEDALYIFAVTKKDLQIRTVGISRKQLYDLIRQYREAIGDTINSAREKGGWVPTVRSWRKEKLPGGVDEWAKVSRRLYDLLVQPVQRDIASFDHVIIMPMGLLYYLPFEALLHEEENEQPRFFVQEKAIHYLVNSQDVSLLGKNSSIPNFDSIIVFANPPRSATLSELPAAEIEAGSIKEIFSKTQAFIGPDASEARFNSRAESASIIHLATHSVMDKQFPENSYIHLAKTANDGYDGRLTMSEISRYSLRSNDLVVLSACETALGVEKEPGSQISTMAESFRRAEAPTVMATLWPIADIITADFMEKFYFNLQTMNKVEAKRQAQLSLLAKPRTTHPLFWAPFVILGDG